MSSLTIISGGQTGADQGALLAAHDLGIPTGGYITRGFMTEKGPMPARADFGLIALDTSDYVTRTRMNAMKGDVTFWSGTEDSRGVLATKRECRNAGKPFIVTTHWCVAQLMEYIIEHPQYHILNFAGNRESSSPGIQENSRAFLRLAFTPFAPRRPLP